MSLHRHALRGSCMMWKQVDPSQSTSTLLDAEAALLVNHTDPVLQSKCEQRATTCSVLHLTALASCSYTPCAQIKDKQTTNPTKPEKLHSNYYVFLTSRGRRATRESKYFQCNAWWRWEVVLRQDVISLAFSEVSKGAENVTSLRTADGCGP